MIGTNLARSIECNRLLLVEGMDEVNMTSAILRHSSIDGIQVIALGGKYKFRPKMEALMSNAQSRGVQLSAIGIMRDADDYPRRAFQSITDALRSLSLPVPSSQGEFVQGNPSLGIFILPDGESKGSIEDLCWASVKETAAGECTASYLQCLKREDALESKSAAKTLVHSYLSTQEDPSARAGEGALKGYWNFKHPAFDPLKKFLLSLATV